MLSSKYGRSPRKRRNSELNSVVSRLERENGFLKRILDNSHHHFLAINKLLERLLTLETLRLENRQQLKAKDENIALESEQPSNNEDHLMDGGGSMWSQRITSCYSREIEEIKTKLAGISALCQHLEDKVAKQKCLTSDEETSADTTKKLQHDLKDALEKNKQWLEYDQQREAYVRAVLARMLWLETQLNEANKARSQQHNEELSAVKEQIRHMQQHFDGILLKAVNELEVLRNLLDKTCQNQIKILKQCMEREEELKELQEQLRTKKLSAEEVRGDHDCSVSEEQEMSKEAEELQRELNEERRRSMNLEIMAGARERFLINRHHEDQDTITKLAQQMKISAQDLEDQKQDCSYLKKRLVSVRKLLQHIGNHVREISERDQEDGGTCEGASPPSPPSRDGRQSSRHSSIQNESVLECPVCQTLYPASQYKDLIHHLEMCQD